MRLDKQQEGETVGEGIDREFSALGWRFTAPCWWDGVIRVAGGEIGNFVPWGGVSLHRVGGRE